MSRSLKPRIYELFREYVNITPTPVAKPTSPLPSRVDPRREKVAECRRTEAELLDLLDRIQGEMRFLPFIKDSPDERWELGTMLIEFAGESASGEYPYGLMFKDHKIGFYVKTPGPDFCTAETFMKAAKSQYEDRLPGLNAAQLQKNLETAMEKAIEEKKALVSR